MAAVIWPKILERTRGRRLQLPTTKHSLSLSENMAAILSFASITPHVNSHHHTLIFKPNYCPKKNRLRCNGENPVSKSSRGRESEPENALLKIAWYGSELLGIAASFFRSPSNVEAPERVIKLAEDGSTVVERDIVVETIKDDFERSYFVTG
jgi:hypothetical protein